MDKIGANLQASRPGYQGAHSLASLPKCAQMHRVPPKDEGVPMSFPCMTDRTLVGSIIQEH